MTLSDWIQRQDVRTAPDATEFSEVLEAAFPPGHPHRGLIGTFLATQSDPVVEAGAALPHLTRGELPRPELTFVVAPRGVRVGGQCARLWVIGLFPSEQPELHLQILSLVAAFCRSYPDADGVDLYEKIVEFGAPGRQFYANLSRERVFEELGARMEGLSAAEAAERRQIHGANELRPERRTPAVLALSRNFVSIFALMLWVAGALCFLPGVDMPPLGWAIFAVILVNGVFSFWQEAKAERAVEALQRMLPALAWVRRDGAEVQVAAADLVPGDILAFEEGDRLPADVRLIEADDLRIDNSNLTGESRPLYKIPEPVDSGPYFLWTEVPNLVFAGTQVASGRGRGVVIGTGMQTEIGKIARLTQTVRRELSPLQREMKRAVNLMSLAAIAIGALFFVIGQTLGGLSLLGALVFTIGITVANIPEGLLPTLSLALAMGVQRMARRQVLVKNLASVETLGSTTVICTDKTGTLTTNRISVNEFWVDGRVHRDVDAEALGEGGRLFFLVAGLCNNARQVEGGIVGDPTEGALLQLAARAGVDLEQQGQLCPRVGHLPFESVRKRMSTLNRVPGEGERVLTKGAPLELLERCTHVFVGGRSQPLDQHLRSTLKAQLDEWARHGRRTLGLATRLWPGGEWTKERAETGLTFVGATSMVDPPRPEVAQAVALCHRAGIRMVMITGDYGPTAAAIAEEIGMSHAGAPARVCTGREVEAMDETALKAFLREGGALIFARMEPAHKMRVVETFKALGETVAVTGDGINDAAALKRADIGIAMGAGVNDVVKEASSMVVLDGNFASIVAAVEEGRAVYANIRRFVTYVFASNVPELVPVLLSVLAGLPLPLTVMQILAIDLGTDLVPALGLGSERPEPGIMDRPPRPKAQHLIDGRVFLRSYLFLGILEAALSLGAYFWAYGLRGWVPGLPLVGHGPVYQAATTMALAGIVAAQIGNVLACRTERASLFQVGWSTNRLALAGIGVELGLLALLIHVPFLANIFGLVPLSLLDWAVLPLFPFVMLGADEARKRWLRRSTQHARA